MDEKRLIIVESPSKARTIQRFAGSSYRVAATMGHIIDLPRKGLGVDVQRDFTPRYVTIKGKENVIRDLQGLAQSSSEIFLAPDPDREGEAIAWHLKNVLESDHARRIELHEITAQALRVALENPRDIDLHLVNAQQARRILDRLVGYKLSPLLWKKVTRGLSAGRVQSVAVRLICEREKEIMDFVPEEFWTITAVLSRMNEEDKFEASLEKKLGEKIKISNEEEAQKILDELQGESFMVSKITVKEQKRNPAAPFITSTLQQEASRRLGFRPARTMLVAQQLYEGLDVGPEGRTGLVTYIRTDSTRISDGSRAEARDFILKRYGESFVGPMRQYKSRPGAQEAHEAIRPTSIWREPGSIRKYLAPEQFRLYRLIWERYLASQMSSCLMEVTTVDICAGEYLFRAQGSSVKFPGFTAVYSERKEDDADRASGGVLPPLEAGDDLALHSLVPEQHFTQPPPRYTEASLIRTLEEKGIGRPSTYAPIVDTIQKRGYVELKEKKFYPTELGKIVTDLLIGHFPEIVNVNFTAEVEEKLDRIEDGNAEWIQVLREFYDPFSMTLSAAEQKIEKVNLKAQEIGENCALCGKPLVLKRGRFGVFIACPGFPDCRYTRPYAPEIGVPCPQDGCSGNVVEKSGKKGKYYTCSLYPRCNFISWRRPTDKKCQVCGKVLVYHFTRSGYRFLSCIDRECASKKHPGSPKMKRRTSGHPGKSG